ncbi:hypothetical protein FHT36_000353 [Xanthobacter sp. SG618]|uniref:hypothetical protein n=1 Tax=Xanthobacter sp. SG618 TaxID=2587121 RepID=UPI00145E6D3C|nr:hypothetical protein [Xanthobacter sp. SG618]NMN56475.1 hypothetical protein [Xanthobacter sp. SG618]
MAEDNWLNPNAAPPDQEVAFDYVKSSDFRVIWADGVIGSITPHGLIHFALYAERHSIPRRQVFSVEKIDDESGRLGAEILEKQISRGSIVRDMACDVFISEHAAENLANWLLSRVEELRKIRGEDK